MGRKRERVNEEGGKETRRLGKREKERKKEREERGRGSGLTVRDV